MKSKMEPITFTFYISVSYFKIHQKYILKNKKLNVIYQLPHFQCVVKIYNNIKN